MAAVVATLPKVSTSPKKRPTTVKKPMDHPKYSEMINSAVSSLKERSGSSRQAILKYIMSNYSGIKDEKRTNGHLKIALKAGIKTGKLKQMKGTGASGSFKLGEVKKEKKAKKPTKSAASKSVKKPKSKSTSSKSPKKPKTKKAKSPSKSRKSPAKKTKSKATKKTTTKSKSSSSKKSKSPKKPKSKRSSYNYY